MSPVKDGPVPDVTLASLVTALDSAVVDLAESPAGPDVVVASAALVDRDDLAAELEAPEPIPDVYLLVGVPGADVVHWLDVVAGRPADRRPVAVMIKAGSDPAVTAAAQRASVALVSVHPKARWDQVLSLVERMLRRRRSMADDDDMDRVSADTDLFELAQMVAQHTGGLVSIEDARSKVLAYSASDESADELRILSIMGREGPREYLRALQEWGVFDGIRETDEVVDVPAHEELKTRRRLVVGIRHTSQNRRSAALLGSIWVQQGTGPLSPDAAEVLRGAAAVAAGIIDRTINAPTTVGLLTQRLFGARGSGVDIPTVAGALSLPTAGPAAVIAFAALPGRPDAGIHAGRLTDLLRLHASSFRRDAVATRIDDRSYVLLPQYKSARSVTAWVRQIVEQFETGRGVVVRAAIALPVAELAGVPAARAEVDRVLDATAPDDRVTTLAESLTPVLLGEILDAIGGNDGLRDPRLRVLDDYDLTHDSALAASARAFLAAHGDVRRAAQAVNVHPNTLRYRLRRVEEILGIDLADHDDRLLLEVQLAVRERASSRSTAG